MDFNPFPAVIEVVEVVEGRAKNIVDVVSKILPAPLTFARQAALGITTCGKL